MAERTSAQAAQATTVTGTSAKARQGQGRKTGRRVGKDDSTFAATTDGGMRDGEMTARERGDVDAGGVESAPLIEAIHALDEVPEQAYRLHMRGHSQRAIAAKLGINKNTVTAYIRAVEAELAPAKAAKRERLRRVAERRLLHLRREAWAHYELTGELGALNTARGVEESLAKLHGLYTAEDMAGAGRGGVQVTIRYVNDWRGKPQVSATATAATENDSHVEDVDAE